MMNTYWANSGAEQAKYDEIMKAVENGEFELLKKTETIFHSYYRYNNDGDFPGWARGNWRFQRWGRWGLELNEAGEEAQEKRVTEAILKEYGRLLKSRK